MKTLTCKDLGGPCDKELSGVTFEEVSEKCKAHVLEMVKNGDNVHQTAAERMRNATSEEQKEMMREYRQRFEEA